MKVHEYIISVEPFYLRGVLDENSSFKNAKIFWGIFKKGTENEVVYLCVSCVLTKTKIKSLKFFKDFIF